MEFNTFHNIKMEPAQLGGGGAMGAWPASAANSPPSEKKVNPFMQWAIFNSVQGFMIAPGSQTPSDLSGTGRNIC